MTKTTLNIKGMHCRSCEILIEENLLQVPYVTVAKVSHKKGQAEVYHEKPLDDKKIEKAIEKAGYTLGTEKKRWFSTNINDYLETTILGIILVGFIYIANDSGLFRVFDRVSNNFASLPVVFLIGLTAGISTCAALVGGLVLGTSAKFAQKHPTATISQKFIPHIFFNLGRIISFFVFGSLLGLIGSWFQLSLSFIGFLTILVGLVMVFFGVQLINLFPKLSTMSFSLPTQVSKTLGIKNHSKKEYSHINAVVLGALTFFLPCGFTQVVQLYAITTRDPFTSALTMGVFALGTTPGLLGIGGLTSLVKGAFARSFFRFAGVVVVTLAVFNISNGINLTGLKSGAFLLSNSTTNVNSQGETQVLKTSYTLANDIQPNEFTVKAGQPVKMEVEVKESGFGCMGSFALPGLSNKVEMLEKNKTLVYEFTPSSAGTYDITCAMGIPRGKIIVN